MTTINGQRVLVSGALILPANTTWVSFPSGLGEIGLKTHDAQPNVPEFDPVGWWGLFVLDPTMTTTGQAEHTLVNEPALLEVDWIAEPMKFRQSVHYRFMYTVRQVPKP